MNTEHTNQSSQGEPVNQQLLALVKSFGHKTGCAKNAFGEQCTCGVDEAITAAEQVTLCASCARANVDCPIYPQQTASCVEYRPAAQQQAEPVAYGKTPGCKQCDEAEACGLTFCPECDAQFCEGHDSAEEIAAQPPAVAVPDGLLTADDMEALQRFAECCEDFESGGHDVPKAAMKRLELAGAVRSCGFGRHETTLFGDAMLAAAPQGVDSSVQVADEKECLHHFVMFRNECMKCGQPYDAAQKGGEA